MKRIIGAVKAAAKWQRLLALVLTVVFMLSAFMTGTVAWADMSQHKTNIAKGEGSPKPGDAILQKYEKDKDGKVTTFPIPGAEFTLYRVNDDGTALLIKSFITGSDGQVLASNLEQGDYYWQETRLPQFFLPETENGQPKKYHFSIPSADGKPILSTAYNTRQYGKLALTKTVKNANNSELTQEQRDLLFEFTVTFSDGGSYAYSIGGGAPLVVESGGKITLKSGQTAQFDSIPTGIHYQITETPVPGYTTRSENNSGNIPGNSITAAFTNTCTNGKLTINKTLTGTGADLNKEFSFTAVIGGKTETFTLKHGQSKTFDNIPLNTDYTVTEADYSSSGYIPTNKMFSGKITALTDNVVLPFVNNYEKTTDKKGNLEISKTVTGDDDSDREFTFQIDFIGEGVPDFPKTFTLKHGRSRTFTGIPHGVQYTVREVVPDGYISNFTDSSGVISGGHTAMVGFVNNIVPDSSEIKLTVKKVVEGPFPDSNKNKLFHFTLTINGVAQEFDLKDGETKEFKISSGDVYSLVESDYTADDYVQSSLINGYGTVGDESVEAIQTNKYIGIEYIDIEGEKTWDMTGTPPGTQLPESIIIQLRRGNEILRTVTVTPDSDGGWRYSFDKVPKRDILGNEYQYTVQEVRIPGWRPITDGFNIKNVYQPPVTDDSVEVEKTVTGEEPPVTETFIFILTPLNGAPMPSDNQVTIKGEGKASFGQITYTLPGTYIYTIAETDGGVSGWYYDAEVYTLTVTVTEKAGQLQANRVLTKKGIASEKVLFTNRYNTNGDTISVRVSKVWKQDTENNRPQNIQVQLYQDNNSYGEPVKLSDANGWKWTWSDLNKNSVWTVNEVDVPEGYTKDISGDQINGFVITNTKGDSNKISVKVTKVWKGADENRPQSVAVQLYKDGAATDIPVTLSAGNSWSYTWNQLEKGSVWTVNEINVPDGYNKAITGDTANGFVITNTKIPEPTLPSSPSQPATLPSSPSQPATTPSSPSQPATLPSSPSQPATLPSSPSQPATTPSSPSQPATSPSSPSQPATSPSSPSQPATAPSSSVDDKEIVIRGRKTWNHGDNPGDKWPNSVTVIIKGNGIIVRQRQISAEDNWSWTLSMPEYDNGGNRIVYTVDEAQIGDYVKTIDGYNIINTYKPDFNPNSPATPDEPGNTNNPSGPGNPKNPGDSYEGGDKPKTEDPNNMPFWITLMFVSLIMCILLIFPWKHKWNGKQYISNK